MGTRVFALTVAVTVAVLVGIPRVQLLLSDKPDLGFCQFAAYPAEEHFHGKPKLSSLQGFNLPDAFRPFIANAAHDGPNFAGAYTVIPYELVNELVKVLVISARTGVVYRAPDATTYVLRHKLDSRLLVYQADPAKRNAGKVKCFEFRGRQFFEVKEPKSGGH